MPNAVNNYSVEDREGYDRYLRTCQDISRSTGSGVNPASFEDWVARERFSTEFSDGRALAAAASDPLGRRRGGQDEATQMRLNKLASEWVRARQIGIQPATILNMSPLQLQGAGPLTSHIVIPPCPRGQLARRYVIESPQTVTDMAYDWRDERDDNWTPVLWYPIQLARDFEQTYYSKGGVVIFQGDHDPASDSKVLAAISEADGRMIDYAKEQWRDANHQWNSPNRTGARNIGVLHRAYAQVLLDRKIFTDVPPWLDATPENKGLGEDCPRCGAKAPKFAYFCPGCAYVIDPKTAYLNMEIDETNPALARLERAILDELGIPRQLVRETLTERKERIGRGEQVYIPEPEPETPAVEQSEPKQEQGKKKHNG